MACVASSNFVIHAPEPCSRELTLPIPDEPRLPGPPNLPPTGKTHFPRKTGNHFPGRFQGFSKRSAGGPGGFLRGKGSLEVLGVSESRRDSWGRGGGSPVAPGSSATR